MNPRESVSASFRNLLAEGRQVLDAVGWNGSSYKLRRPGSEDYFRIRTMAMNLVRRACGSDSDHYSELKRLSEHSDAANSGAYLAHCVGIVEAAHRDFESGLLFDMRALIAADILGDFIEQAEHLLEANYYRPAASLAGAVLEDTLRKICDKHGIPVPESTKIDRLNAELAKSNIYDKLIQKRITAIADIRNNADHGHFDKFKKEDVEDMIKWIRNFSADYLK